ncbi:MAG: PKD domain-containing protein, partial [Anaerolineae bacterium]
MNLRRALALLFSFGTLVGVAILLFVSASASAQAPPSPRRPAVSHLPGGSTLSGTLTLSDTWGPGTITLTGDISVAAGVVITLVPQTTVQVAVVDGANLGLDPNRIEYLVAGELRASGPVTFTSRSPAPAGGDWFGLRFLPGSTGELSLVTVEYGLIGIWAEDAALVTLAGSTIRYMHGADGVDGSGGFSGNPGNPGGDGSPGSPAYGLYLTGTTTAQIAANQIYSITGGTGGAGGSGGNGLGGVPTGASGGPGGAGAGGGPATGIFVGRAATAWLLTNTVQSVAGGAGGPGGIGGDGTDGLPGGAAGGPGGNGGQGGPGGAGGQGAPARGIHFQEAGNDSVAHYNPLYDLYGGPGGDGGQGGNGGHGGDGGPGGDGGFGGDGGRGGDAGGGGLAAGLHLARCSPPALENDIDRVVAGAGAPAGDGGLGGAAGDGGDSSEEQPGGDGGEPGGGGDGGNGGSGGEANGLRVDGTSTASLKTNTVDGIYGGAGGPAGRGGHGGHGGHGGAAHGIRVQGPGASPHIVTNHVTGVYAGGGGDGGWGGDGGAGGAGGRGGNGDWIVGMPPGPGGDGGDGQTGGNGGSGGPGGPASGILVLATTLAQPLQRNAVAEIAGGAGGLAGIGGLGGNGGPGGDGGDDLGLVGPGAPGGAGGLGGDGGDGGAGGDGGSAAGLYAASATHHAINNLVHDVTPGDAAGGGHAGDGGAGGPGGGGGFGGIMPPTPGGPGGDGGDGGDGGLGGDGGDSAGLQAQAASVTYYHNTVADVGDGGADGPGGGLGLGGPGGPGGESNPVGFPGPTGLPGVDGLPGGDGLAGDSMGLWATNGANLVVTNNVLAHTSPPGANTYGLRLAAATATVGYNDVWSHTVQYSGLPVPGSDLAAAPLFLDWPGDDYHLRRGSPCLDAGTGLGVGDDFDGQARPLGAGPEIGFDEVAPLLAAKAVDRDLAGIGWPLVYTLAITNPDPQAPAPGVALVDQLPPGVTFAGGPACDLPACAYVAASEAVTWTGDVPTGTVWTLVYTVTVDGGLADGTSITNTALLTVTGGGGRTNEVTTTIHTPLLTLTKEAEGTSVAGLPFTYTLLVTNHSPYVAGTGVVVTDAVPAGGRWVSGGSHAGGIVTLTYPFIAAAETASASWQVSTCQTSITNQRYRVVTSAVGITSGWGPPLLTDLPAPTLVPTFSLSAEIAHVGQTVVLTDRSAFDGASLVAWQWAFGDGQVGQGTPVTHAYSQTGSYSLTLS